MELLNLKVETHNNIFLLLPKTRFSTIEVTLEKLEEAKYILENTFNKTFDVGMFVNHLGYFKAYDFNKNKHIYCASLSKKSAINLVNEYLNKK